MGSNEGAGTQNVRQAKQSTRRRSGHGQQSQGTGRRSNPKHSSKVHARTARTGLSQADLKTQAQQTAQFQYRALLPTVPENTEYRHKRDFKPLYVKLPVVSNRNPQYTSIRQCLRSYEQWLNVRFPGYDRPITAANMMRLFFTHPKLFFDLCTATFKKPPPVKSKKGKGAKPEDGKGADVSVQKQQQQQCVDNSKLSACAHFHGYGPLTPTH
eukprot:TRINITY_DN17255_c0_g1_i1.p1 TRINITY_DN17255_c0_g1~~TRINITY_DN17255_c0_g1_i1.p1  ORF type:complete len:246 (-),score=28.54 TRINITY_DN17255_c0_g1_i1:419-1054(-)